MRAIRFVVLLLGVVCGSYAGARRRQISNPSDQVRRRLPGRRAERHHRPHLLRMAAKPHLGQPCVVENKVGQGGMIAAKSVIDSPPDGYTFMFVAPNNAIGQTLYKNLPFNHVRDTTPIAGIMQLANMMVVPPIAAGEDRRRVHRLRQGQSGQAHLRVVRQRHLGPHVGRAVQVS